MTEATASMLEPSRLPIHTPTQCLPVSPTVHPSRNPELVPVLHGTRREEKDKGELAPKVRLLARSSQRMSATMVAAAAELMA